LLFDDPGLVLLSDGLVTVLLSHDLVLSLMSHDSTLLRLSENSVFVFLPYKKKNDDFYIVIGNKSSVEVTVCCLVNAHFVVQLLFITVTNILL